MKVITASQAFDVSIGTEVEWFDYEPPAELDIQCFERVIGVIAEACANKKRAALCNMPSEIAKVLEEDLGFTVWWECLEDSIITWQVYMKRKGISLSVPPQMTRMVQVGQRIELDAYEAYAISARVPEFKFLHEDGGLSDDQVYDMIMEEIYSAVINGRESIEDEISQGLPESVVTRLVNKGYCVSSNGISWGNTGEDEKQRLRALAMV